MSFISLCGCGLCLCSWLSFCRFLFGCSWLICGSWICRGWISRSWISRSRLSFCWFFLSCCWFLLEFWFWFFFRFSWFFRSSLNLNRRFFLFLFFFFRWYLFLGLGLWSLSSLHMCRHFCGLNWFPLTTLSLNLASSLKLWKIDIWVRLDGISNDSTPIRHCFKVWPHTRQAFRENKL